MTRLVPRLGRDDGLSIIHALRSVPLGSIGQGLPQRPTVAMSPVGGVPLTDAELSSLRKRILDVARRAGFPDPPDRAGQRSADVEMAGVLRDSLDLSASEASSEDVWTYLTCCWLPDVALWRWSGTRAGGEDRRYWGHVDRNTFRRLWTRARVLDDGTDLGRRLFGLGEDELVAITERSSLTRDPRIARAIARTFATRVSGGTDDGVSRMFLMRDVAARVRRLTPIIEFGALSDPALDGEIAALLDESVSAVSGTGRSATVAPVRMREVSPPPSAGVRFDRPRTPEPKDLSDQEVRVVALELAGRVGHVTNVSLREALPHLEAEAARATLHALVHEGRLERHGQTRGTRYVLAQSAAPLGADEDRRFLRRFFGR